MATSGCLRAVQLDDGVLKGRMQFTPPPGWEISRNYRYLGSHNVILISPTRHATVSVQMLPLEERARDVPLDLLGETLIGNAGRSLGIETTLTSKYEVVLADRRAYAFTGWRKHGPNETDVTAIVTRSDRHTVLVILTAPRQNIGEYADIVELVMESLIISDEPAPPARLDSW